MNLDKILGKIVALSIAGVLLGAVVLVWAVVRGATNRSGAI